LSRLILSIHVFSRGTGANHHARLHSSGRRIGGLILGGLPAVFLLLDAGMKLAKPEFVAQATTEIGYSEDVIVLLGAVLLVSTLLDLIPRTAVLGAILLTGYLGGAVATNVHAGRSGFDILFPALFGALLWGGLCLRNDRLRELILRHA
jgi:hypothetical protein